MTNEANVEPVRIYLQRLGWALKPLPAADRESILAEIEGHIRERSHNDSAKAVLVLDGLGSPDSLARAYVEDHELAGVVNRAAPGALFMNVLARSTRSGVALVGSFAAALLYLMSLGLLLTAVVKPIIPAHVGFWVQPGGFQIGFLGAATGREVLGYWIIPVAILGAILCYAVGTILIRRCGRWLLRRPTKLRTT